MNEERIQPRRELGGQAEGTARARPEVGGTHGLRVFHKHKAGQGGWGSVSKGWSEG